MHVKLDELDKAEYYGRLSVRQKNADYIFYLNNFSNILLKKQKYKLALAYLSKAIPEVKKANNFYHKVGFTSLFIKALIKTKSYKQAISYGKTFLDVYQHEIFNFRWHLFFNVYLEALFFGEVYNTIVHLCKKYNFNTKEQKLSGTKNRAPKIQWYCTLSQYMTNSISEKKCIEKLKKSIVNTNLSDNEKQKLAFLLKMVSPIMYKQIF
ncbi:MAG: hypothetical protein B6I20_10530 [Bacteroidetes bacterium 4572_117]|nr:MAG: hypothetical protein B6I20_10530 [Bacteroidetes bacterium 4572_117]